MRLRVLPRPLRRPVDEAVQGKAFIEALHHSRWTSYSLVYCDVAEMPSKGCCARTWPGSVGQLAQALVGMGERTFASHGLPGGAGGFLGQSHQRLEKRLALAQLHAPRPVREIPKTDLEAVLASLPIHPSIRGHDFELLQNHLRINLVRIYEDFLAAADRDRLATELSPEGVEPAALQDASRV
jgi:hypothetical protein